MQYATGSGSIMTFTYEGQVVVPIFSEEYARGLAAILSDTLDLDDRLTTREVMNAMDEVDEIFRNQPTKMFATEFPYQEH